MTGITRSGIAFLFGFSVYLFRARNIWHTPYGLRNTWYSILFLLRSHTCYLSCLLTWSSNRRQQQQQRWWCGDRSYHLGTNNDGIRISEKAKEVVVNYSMIIDILQSMFLFTSLIHFSSCLWWVLTHLHHSPQHSPWLRTSTKPKLTQPSLWKLWI